MKSDTGGSGAVAWQVTLTKVILGGHLGGRWQGNGGFHAFERFDAEFVEPVHVCGVCDQHYYYVVPLGRSARLFGLARGAQA